MTVLISPEELRVLVNSAQPPHLLDVRWSLQAPRGQGAYVAGHIPGAVFVDLESELAQHFAPSSLGRHPLPDLETLQRAARRWGIVSSGTVVVYDDVSGLSAARAWWLLRHAGVKDVRILDGALDGWRRIGGPLEGGTPAVVPGNVSLSYGHLPTLTISDAALAPRTGVLLDARARERYLGTVEPVDPRAGHIPGAISAPTSENLDSTGKFLPADALRARFASLGVTSGDDVGVYCGSGITAAHEIAALAIAGIDAALYPGSWSQWANHPILPVETAESFPEPTPAPSSLEQVGVVA